MSTTHTVQLARGTRASIAAERPARLAALRAPLALKLVGANALVLAMLYVMSRATGATIPANAGLFFLLTLVAHFGLVLIALRPIRDLEEVAARAWRGDFTARVGRSKVADQEVLRIGSMFNILLDGLESDRARLRALAAEIISVGDRERAAVARELHDSTAQEIAALLLQLSTAARDSQDPALADRLRSARDSTAAILEEVRVISHVVHPGVLDDLGLEAALRRLARDASNGNGIDIDVSADIGTGRLPKAVEGVLYRIAQEAVRNATKHANPERIRIALHKHPLAVRLDIHDDGAGFDLSVADGVGAGLGLLSMRERAALLDGQVDIKTAPGSGTTISATIPLAPATQPID